MRWAKSGEENRRERREDQKSREKTRREKRDRGRGREGEMEREQCSAGWSRGLQMEIIAADRSYRRWLAQHSRRQDCHSADPPPLHVMGVSIWKNRGCQQSDSLAYGWAGRCRQNRSGGRPGACQPASERRQTCDQPRRCGSLLLFEMLTPPLLSF